MTTLRPKMSRSRPLFSTCWARFTQINVPVSDVGKKIGGKVEFNITQGIFVNACPIRISYVLNRVGVHIPGPASGYSVVSGADTKWYIFKVKDMIQFLERRWGKPDKVVRGATSGPLAGRRGLIVVEGAGWSDASGHVTLWNGTRCQDSCHLARDPDNGSFTPRSAKLWELQ